MLYDIMLSLRLHTQASVPELTRAQFIYDGVVLTGLEKPFLTIENFASPTTYESAGRKSVRESYAFQIGLFANNFTEFVRLQESVKVALQKVDYYDENGKTDKSFVCSVSDFTPIGNDDLANETFNFHGYFDVTVVILRDIGSKDFTQ